VTVIVIGGVSYITGYMLGQVYRDVRARYWAPEPPRVILAEGRVIESDVEP
jgi:hypothetical protein